MYEFLTLIIMKINIYIHTNIMIRLIHCCASLDAKSINT